MSTPQRMNDFDGERIVQVDGLPDIPYAKYNCSDHKPNQYPERYNDDYPSHPYRDQDFGYDNKTHLKRESTPPYSQPDSIRSDENSNLLDDTLTQLLQSQNDIQQKTCELLSTLSNKPPSTEFMHDVLTNVTVYDIKNIPLECWLLQIEKAQQFTNLPYYDIALCKSIDTPYKQLSRVAGSKPWENIKKMLEEAHAPYPVKFSAITNMFRKQKEDKTLQDYIQYFIDKTDTALGCYPIDVTKYIYYVSFSQGLCNSHLKRKVQGVTNIKCLNDAFKIAQNYLNKENSFECLNNNDPVLHKNDDRNNAGYITINNVASSKPVNNEVSQLHCDHCINEINMQQPVDQRYPPGGYQGYCYRCGQWGHMAKNCGENMNIAGDTVHHDREIPHTASAALKKALSQSAFPPRTAFEKGKDYSVMTVGKSLLTQIKEDNFILGDTKYLII